MKKELLSMYIFKYKAILKISGCQNFVLKILIFLSVKLNFPIFIPIFLFLSRFIPVLGINLDNFRPIISG